MKFLKTILSAFLCVGAAMGFSACGDDDKPAVPSFGDKDFNCTVTELAYPMGGGDNVITVTSSVKPEVTIADSWATVGNMTVQGSKQNIYKITISAAENPNGEDRSTVATVKGATESAQITLKQTAKPMITLDPQSLIAAENIFPAEGGTREIKVTSNLEIKAEGTAGWVTVGDTRAMVEHTVTFTVSANPTSERRTASVVISPVNSSEVNPVTVAISQEGNPNAGASLSAMEVARAIHTGVNIGNTMECPSGEAEWLAGKVKVNLQYIQGLKAMGFNAVRIPCAWDSHVIDGANNTLDPEWLKRVDDVVGMILGEDMFAVLNIHWDGGWLETSVSEGYKEEVNKKQKDYWTQIANQLSKYGSKLLFAGMNEPGMQSGVNDGTPDAIMRYQQTFVDAVRATGGNNALRVLVHQAPNTNIDEAVKGKWKLPTDVIEDRAIVEVHFYDPSDYTIMEKDGAWSPKVKLYWGAKYHVAGSDRNCTWGEESSVDAQFKKMQDNFVSKGIPVIIGEYSATTEDGGDPARKNLDGFDLDRFRDSRAYWTEYVTKSAKDHGCVPFYWETGGDINRNNGTAKYQYAIDAIMRGADAGKYPF